MTRPWLVPPEAFNAEGVSWAVRRASGGGATPMVVLCECTTSEPAGIELSELEVAQTLTEPVAHEWLSGFMPDADAERIAAGLVAALGDG